METTTNPASRRAASIRRTWPSCRAPIVGTRPRVRPSARAAWTAWRTSRIVVARGDSGIGIPTRRSGKERSCRPGAMGARGVVQAGVGDHEVIEDLAGDEGPGDDPGD